MSASAAATSDSPHLLVGEEDVGLAQARNVERMANSALMLNPGYLAGVERYIKGIGRKS
jgi:hypothetical protein